MASDSISMCFEYPNGLQPARRTEFANLAQAKESDAIACCPHSGEFYVPSRYATRTLVEEMLHE